MHPDSLLACASTQPSPAAKQAHAEDRVFLPFPAMNTFHVSTLPSPLLIYYDYWMETNWGKGSFLAAWDLKLQAPLAAFRGGEALSQYMLLRTAPHPPPSQGPRPTQNAGAK